jgi:hypothetical protein
MDDPSADTGNISKIYDPEPPELPPPAAAPDPPDAPPAPPPIRKTVAILAPEGTGMTVTPVAVIVETTGEIPMIPLAASPAALPLLPTGIDIGAPYG